MQDKKALAVFNKGEKKEAQVIKKLTPLLPERKMVRIRSKTG